MYLGEPVRVLHVEPVVSPVPDGDFPEVAAALPEPRPRPTPRRGAGVPPARRGRPRPTPITGA
ncbi:hypothetical protein [Actinomycetospora straminea]|uniref:Uncharacterized protein n=1 Tax=Actinomycetospora straminea TaxID=663607 RepID=A0ABP9EZW0_9PSEU|nr:hypothetical protein [Actinomycetospora straminea]MDD7931810.1 hypothetical protein [Actinomycetospora straminea]